MATPPGAVAFTTPLAPTGGSAFRTHPAAAAGVAAAAVAGVAHHRPRASPVRTLLPGWGRRIPVGSAGVGGGGFGGGRLATAAPHRRTSRAVRMASATATGSGGGDGSDGDDHDGDDGNAPVRSQQSPLPPPPVVLQPRPTRHAARRDMGGAPLRPVARVAPSWMVEPAVTSAEEKPSGASAKASPPGASIEEPAPAPPPEPAPETSRPSREPASSDRPAAPAQRLGWEQPPPIPGGAAGDAPLVSWSRQASAPGPELLPTLFNGPASVIGFVLAALALALDFLRHVTTVMAAASANSGTRSGGAVKTRSPARSAASAQPDGAPLKAAATPVTGGGVPARVAFLERQAAASAAALAAARTDLATAQAALRAAEARSTAERKAEAAAVAEATAAAAAASAAAADEAAARKAAAADAAAASTKAAALEAEASRLRALIDDRDAEIVALSSAAAAAADAAAAREAAETAAAAAATAAAEADAEATRLREAVTARDEEIEALASTATKATATAAAREAAEATAAAAAAASEAEAARLRAAVAARDGEIEALATSLAAARAAAAGATAIAAGGGDTSFPPPGVSRDAEDSDAALVGVTAGMDADAAALHAVLVRASNALSAATTAATSVGGAAANGASGGGGDEDALPDAAALDAVRAEVEAQAEVLRTGVRVASVNVAAVERRQRRNAEAIGEVVALAAVEGAAKAAVPPVPAADAAVLPSTAVPTADVAAPVVEAAIPAPRRRGRPRKTPASATDGSAEVGKAKPKRKRPGRPRKQT
ncbi:hypothetical protein MMPV_005847 [Pyropia vietnamensis]